jgi:hypothetical protein
MVCYYHIAGEVRECEVDMANAEVRCLGLTGYRSTILSAIRDLERQFEWRSFLTAREETPPSAAPTT